MDDTRAYCNACQLWFPVEAPTSTPLSELSCPACGLPPVCVAAALEPLTAS